MLRPRMSFSERRRALLARKAAESLDALEPRSMITESLGVFTAGIALPTADVATRQTAARKAMTQAATPTTKTAARHHGSEIHPRATVHAQAARGGGHAATIEIGARPEIRHRRSTDWFTLLSRRGAADSGVITLPTIPAVAAPQSGGAISPRGGISAASPSISPLRLPAPPDPAGNSPLVVGSSASNASPGTTQITHPTTRPTVVAATTVPAATTAPAAPSWPDVTTEIGSASRSFAGSADTAGSIPALGQFAHFPVYTIDQVEGVVLFPGAVQYGKNGASMDLRAQVRDTTVSSYSWDTSHLAGVTGVTGTSSYRLQFTWANAMGTTLTDTVVLTVTGSGGQTEVQTYTFIVPTSNSGVSGSTWPEATSSDLARPDAPAFDSHNATVDANTGALDTSILLPSYNPNIAPLALTYDSLAADARPMVVEHHTLDPSLATPTKVSAQLTFNSVAGSTYYYDTSQFAPGDVQQIPLEANATALSTGRYDYSVALGDVRGSTTNSSATGTATVLNYGSNAFGAGWTLAGLEQVTTATGGVILDLGGGGRSLWFAASGGGGAYTSPAGDFSTLALSGGVYTRTMPDGTVYRFDSSGYETSVADSNGLRVTYAYSSGKLSTITDPYSNVTTFHYDGSGKLDTITDPPGRVATIAHSGSDLTGVTLPDSGGWSYAYDGSHRLTQVTDPRTKTVTVAYDSANRVGTITRPDSTSETFKAAQERGYDTSGTSGSPAPALLLAEARASHADPNGHTTDLRPDWRGMGLANQATDPDGNVATEYRDANGLVIVAIDRLARQTQYAYDAQGDVTTLTYADGNVEKYAYNSLAEPTSHTDPLNHTTTYTYDSGGNLTVIQDPLGNRTTMTYTGNGRLATVKNARSNVTSFAYDAQDRLTTITYPINAATRLSAYDTKGNATTVTDERGKVTTYAFDALNRIAGMTDALGNRTTYAYDASGNPTAVQAPLSRTPTYAYDSMDRVTTVTDPLSHATAYGYDSGGNLKAITDPLSRTTTIEYDAEDRPTVVIDALSHRTTTAYDAEGQAIAVTDPLSRTTTTTYNARGWAATITDPLNHTTTYNYTATGKQGTVYSPFIPGLPLVSYTYDADDRLTTVTDPLGHTQVTVYDEVGNVVARVDGNGNRTTFAYDARNRLTTVTDPLSHSTVYGYDDAGNGTTVTDPLSHVTTSAYDDLNRVTTLTDARSAVTTMAYDAAGRRTGLTDPVGNRTTWAYDAADRLTTMTDPMGSTTTYAYDSAGQLIDKTDRNGLRTTFAFDADGRQTAERWLTTSGGTVRTITATYDAAGQLTGLADPDATLTFTYDSGGRQTAAATSGTAGQPLVTLTSGYDDSNGRTSLTDNFASVGRTTYVYDNAHRLGTISTSYGGTAGPQIVFGYDAADRLTSTVRTVGGTGTRVSTTISYDAANRATTITHGKVVTVGFPPPAHDVVTPLATYTYGYDNTNRLTGETNAEGSVSYSYDNADQLTGVSGARSETFTYDSGGNRTMTGYTTATGNELTASPGATYAYDAEGNQTARTDTTTGNVTTYSYDYHNRLTGVTQKNSGGSVLMQATYTYDALGRRIGTDIDADGAGPSSPVQNWTVYDGDNTYADFDGSGNLKVRYLYGPAIDQILSRTDSGGTTAWYLSDRVGSIRDIANAFGTIVDHVAYDAFGAVASESSPSNGDRFKFAAMSWDVAGSLYLARARHYTPAAGRFIQQDPIQYQAKTVNLYAYTNNNPVNGVDPYGTDFLDVTIPSFPVITAPAWLGAAGEMLASAAAPVVAIAFTPVPVGIPIVVAVVGIAFIGCLAYELYAAHAAEAIAVQESAILDSQRALIAQMSMIDPKPRRTDGTQPLDLLNDETRRLAEALAAGDMNAAAEAARRAAQLMDDIEWGRGPIPAGPAPEPSEN